MADLMHIEIAGVCFDLSCPPSIRLRGPDPSYRPFIKKKNTPGTRSIPVRIHPSPGNMPDTSKMQKIFDTEDAWALFRDGGANVIELVSRVSGEKTWQARFDNNFSDVTVFCGDALISSLDRETKIINPVLYPLDQLLLIHVLAMEDGALIHAAGAVFNDKGYIFPGRSGAGKSTLSFKLVGLGRGRMLSDDRVAVRKFDTTHTVFGTPWSGEAGISANEGAPLSGIFFVRHGTENRIKALTRREALERLLPVTAVPWYDEAMMTNLLIFCEDMVSRVPAYDLFFLPNIDVAAFFEKFIAAGLEDSSHG